MHSVKGSVVDTDLPPQKSVQVMSLYFDNLNAKGGPMAKKKFNAEQIIQLLGEVEIHTSEDKTIAQA